jgi:predicted ABC-type ATPase
MSAAPQVVIIAGPNGAGKTTASEGLLKAHGIRTFLNADRIASGLSGLSPDDAAIEAGILMLAQIRKHVEKKESFAFETTLASRTYGPWTRDRLKEGYSIHLHFLWLSTADVAVERVKRRVQSGGHSIPETTIRRRYDFGLKNFFEQYRDRLPNWTFWENERGAKPVVVAKREGANKEAVHDKSLWKLITEPFDGSE